MDNLALDRGRAGEEEERDEGLLTTGLLTTGRFPAASSLASKKEIRFNILLLSLSLLLLLLLTLS